jgi:hypothetical protein
MNYNSRLPDFLKVANKIKSGRKHTSGVLLPDFSPSDIIIFKMFPRTVVY